MTFFSIRTSSEKKIIGTDFPQIQTMSRDVNSKAVDSLFNVYADAFPDFTPDLNYFVVNKSAKLTDFLSASMIGFGFILNDKVKNILTRYKIPAHKFYPAIVEYNGSFHNNYYWFFYISDILEFIDYDKTIFFIADMVDNKIEDCKNIHSAASLKNLIEVLPDDRTIDSEIVFVKNDIAEHLDLIKLPFGNYRTYISEKLYKALEEDNISGINMSPTNKLQITN